MTASVDLVVLKCVKCQAFVPAEEDEAAWVCPQCGQGQHLTESGLTGLEVHWAAAREGATGVQWHPFWVFTGSVTFDQRQSFGRQNEPDQLWNEKRRFYVPAFPAALDKIEALGADLTRRQPALRPGRPGEALKNCVLFPGDAREAVEFVVLTIEADRKDKLRNVQFRLELGEPELWVLPFSGDRPLLAD